MGAVFYLTFFSDPIQITSGEGSHRIHRQAFYVEHITTAWDKMEQCFRCWADEFKQSYEQIDGVSGRSGASVKICGCCCFAPQEKHDQMIESWRKIFHDADPNCVLGPVCKVSAQLIGPTDMLEKTKDAYEHQQAQQLRVTLNEHVGCGSVVAPKKM